MRTLLLTLLVLSLVFTIGAAAFTPTAAAAGDFGGDEGVTPTDPCEPDGLASQNPSNAAVNDDPGPPNCLH